MFGNALANLVVNIIVNARGFSAQLSNVRQQLQQTSVIANRTRNFFLLTGAIYAATEFIKKLGAIETGFIRIERVAKEFKGPGFRDDIFDLAQEISGTSLADVQKIMKISAQLGVRGRDNLLEFSRAMSMMSNVTGLSADTITTDIGKVIQVFGLLPKDAEKVSNVILQVADDFNVVETEITNIVRRIGAFANAIGLSVEETVAFAGAMKDVGVNTEIAASSLYTFFARLQTEPVALGKFFGMANEELFKFFLLLRQNPTEAIIKLLEKIKQMPPSERLAFFEKLELYGVRNAAALGTLAEKVDRLKEALASANKGIEENIRLLEGQWERMNSIEGKIDDLSDAWTRFSDTVGDTNKIQGALEFITNALNVLERRIKGIDSLQHTKIDINNPEAVKNRIEELKALLKKNEENVANAPIVRMTEGLKFRAPGGIRFDLGQEIRNFTEDLHDINSGEAARKELKFLEEYQKRLEEKEKNKASSVETRIKEMTRPSTPAVRQEFENILKRANEEKGKKERADSFRGFMGLTEAWKNLFLDRNKDKEFKELQGIHNEAAEANDHLNDIASKLDNLQFGAILG